MPGLIIRIEDAHSPSRGQGRLNDPSSRSETARRRGVRERRPAGLKALALFLLPIAIVACGRPAESLAVNLPVTPVIELRPRWAVAADVYVRVRERPSPDAPIVSHLRAGDVVEILSINPSTVESDNGRDTWYEISGGGLEGWAPGRSLDFFESRAQAEDAARHRGEAVNGSVTREGD